MQPSRLPLGGSAVTLGAGQRYAVRRVDAFTFERLAKDTAGRTVSILRTQVSRDGRVLTQTTLLPGTAPATAGLAAGDTKVFTRQPETRPPGSPAR